MNTPHATTEKCPASGRTAAWCTDETHATCVVGIAAGIAVDRKVAAELDSDKVECRECNGTGVIAAGVDPETGRDAGRDCWKCGGYGEHVR